MWFVQDADAVPHQNMPTFLLLPQKNINIDRNETPFLHILTSKIQISYFYVETMLYAFLFIL